MFVYQHLLVASAAGLIVYLFTGSLRPFFFLLIAQTVDLDHFSGGLGVLLRGGDCRDNYGWLWCEVDFLVFGIVMFSWLSWFL